jgi:ADP-heptose:LPS heptosyltransferase
VRQRVLVVRAGALGDLLLLRPAIAALQDAGHEVSLLAPSGPAAALIGTGAGDVAEALPWESAAFAGLLVDDDSADPALAARLRPYHAAIAFTRDATLARRLTRHIPAVVRHDPAPPAGGPHAAAWLASALDAIGVTLRAEPPVLKPSAADHARAQATLAALPPDFLALHPGSGSPAKNWPAERFAALAIAAAPRPWLLVRGPADDEAAAVLEPVAGACVARELPLRVLAAVLARAGAYVGNDSGITHLAAAAGARTIALFGPTDPRIWAPIGPRVEVIAADTMSAITVGAVASAVARARCRRAM